MSMTLSRWIRKRRWGLAVGAIATVCIAIVYAAGMLSRLDYYGLDLQFRHAHEIAADDRILLIDIDDTSLELSGYPWPRRQFARLVQSLARAGADSIMLDIVFTGVTPPRVEHADLGRDYDLGDGPVVRGQPSTDEVIYDDDELRDAMKFAGNVYLAMYAHLAPRGVDPDALLARGLELVARTPEISVPELQRRLGVAAPFVDHAFLARLHAVSFLSDSFDLDAEHATSRLAENVPVTAQDFESVWDSARRIVAQRAAERFPFSGTSSDWAAFFHSVLPDADIGTLSPERQVLEDAFRRQRARRYVNRSLLTRADSDSIKCLPRAYDETFPLDKLVEAARGVGFVAYVPEIGAGVLRSLPLQVVGSQTVYPQLGFLVAGDTLGLSLTGELPDDGLNCRGLTLRGENETRVVPIDDRGRTLVAWHVPKGRLDWRNSFHHLPAHRVLHPAAAFESIEENERRIGIMMGALVQRRHRETPSEYERYVDLVNRRWSLRRAELRSLGAAESGDALTARDELDAQIAPIEQDAMVWLERTWILWRGLIPETPTEREDRAAIEDLYRELVEDHYVERLTQLDGRLRDEALASLAELREVVSGRICLVGYTASSVADLVTTPVFAATPGVMVHANIINMMLSNQFVRAAPVWSQLAALAVLGLVATLVTSCFRPVRSLATIGVLAVLVVAAGAAVFRVAHVHFASLPMVVSIAGVWAMVTVARQCTEERSRRHIQRALSQYTSPSIASHIAQDEELRRLTPQPAYVSCFFCDLQGFTPLSERLGPGRTRDLLNPYLDRMSSLLIEHGALVNKFIGDGVFAFFNAPIRACIGHEAAACAAAVACRDALEEMNASLSEPLVMRIGVATGEVFVGDYGSDTKLDYTCIGDRVNLASRLERANKLLGTTILIDEPTRRALDGAWAVRGVGRLRVAGRREPVEAFALEGQRNELDDSWLSSVELFDEAIRHYQACEWDSCRGILVSLERCPITGTAARYYLRAVAQFEAEPPPADWDGAIDVSGA